jgi:hypothetical protein
VRRWRDRSQGSSRDDILFWVRERQERLALRAKPSRCEGLVHRFISCSAASRPIPLRAEASGWESAFSYGGSPFGAAAYAPLLRAGYSNFARIEFRDRWRELWPRSAQDDIP